VSTPNPAEGCAAGCGGLVMIAVGLFILMLTFGGCVAVL